MARAHAHGQDANTVRNPARNEEFAVGVGPGGRANAGGSPDYGYFRAASRAAVGGAKTLTRGAVPLFSRAPSCAGVAAAPVPSPARRGPASARSRRTRSAPRPPAPAGTGC